MTSDELERHLAEGHERRYFEVKGPGALSDKAYCARVARATMALGNLKDGGQVCLGVADTQIAAMLPGLNLEQLKAWSSFDDVSAALARYSDPPVSFTLTPLELSSGAYVVVLQVQEFDLVPHVCKRDYPDVLQQGVTYVRPRGKPESVPVPSSLEMRELLDIAIGKGVADFVRLARVAGVTLSAPLSPEEVSRQAFQAEAAGAWADPSALVEDIVGAGHFDVTIQPGPFDQSRLSPAALESFLSEQTVRLRGWPLPFVDYREPIQRHPVWIGQDIGPGTTSHVEAWRLCTSGQFLHRRVLVTDRHDRPELQPTDPNSAGAVAVWDVLLYAVELAELAARLATTLKCESITFDVTLGGIADRELVAGVWERELHGPYRISASQLVAAESVDSARMIAEPRNVGVELTQQLLRPFGLQVPDQVLWDWQDQTLSRR